ncbi:8633_t:CDS:2, partial [Cetraspora pellucida]
LGADIVVHSVTKYINGHSDVIMGVAVMNDKEISDKLKFLQNAMGASSDKVEEVTYSELESDPQHDLAKKQSKGFGEMLSFKIKGGFEVADTFLQNIKIFTLAESLDGVESLTEHPVNDKCVSHPSTPRSCRCY